MKTVKITVIDGPGLGKAFSSTLPITIGREASTVQFSLPDNDVEISRHHLTLKEMSAGVVVENRGKNGMTVDQRPPDTTVGAQAPIQSDSRIRIGKTVLLVKILVESPAATVHSTRVAFATINHREPLPHEGTRMALTKALSVPDQLAAKVDLVQKDKSDFRFVITEAVPGAMGPRWSGNLEIQAQSITLGRSVRADVILDDVAISSEHCSLVYEKGQLLVKDLQSRNGTFCNNVRVIVTAPVKDRDILTIRPFAIAITIQGNAVFLRVKGLEEEAVDEVRKLTGLMTLPVATSKYRGKRSDVADKTEASLEEQEDAADPADRVARATRMVAPAYIRPQSYWERKKLAAKWQPTSDLKRWDSAGSLLAVGAVSTAILLVMLIAGRGSASLSPGPLSSAHEATALVCTDCHNPQAARPDAGCIGCHAPADSTAASTHEKAGSSVYYFSPHLAPPLPRPLVVGAESQPWLAPAKSPVRCFSCHVEHRGAEKLSSTPTGRCLECHAAAHTTTFDVLKVPSKEHVRWLECQRCHTEHTAPPTGGASATHVSQGSGGAQVAAPSMTLKSGARIVPGVSAVGSLPGRPSPPIVPAAVLLVIPLFLSGAYAFSLYQKRRALSLSEHNRTLQEIIKGLPPIPEPIIPQVNLDLCVGCKACVDACPFHALEMRDGKATLVSKDKCHGVSLCEQICPKRAITMVPNDAKPTTLRPPVTSENESARVKGLFVLGDAVGLPLIKNAINHGVVVAKKVKEQPVRKDVPYDLVIVGAGLAGLSAAVTAKELDLRILVLEQGDVAHTIRHFPRQKIVFGQPVEIPSVGTMNILDGTTKEELIENWDRLLAQRKITVQTNERVDDIQKQGDGSFVVTTAKGRYRGAYVALAIGNKGEPRKLRVPGEESNKVMYSLDDAKDFQHAKIAVVGAGDVGIETALAVELQGTNEVTLIVRGKIIEKADPRNIKKAMDAAAAGRLRILYESEIKEILPDKIVVGCSNEPETSPRFPLENNFVFVNAGIETKKLNAFMEKIGVVEKQKAKMDRPSTT